MSPYHTVWFYVLLAALLFVILSLVLLALYAKNKNSKVLSGGLTLYYLALIFFTLGCIIYAVSYYLSSNIDRALNITCNTKCAPYSCTTSTPLSYTCESPTVAPLTLGEEPAKTPTCMVINGVKRMKLSTFAKYL